MKESQIIKAEHINDEDIIEKSHIEYETYHLNGKQWLRKRNKSDKTPIYNTPITASKEFTAVKEAKQKISENGYKEEDVEYFLNKLVTDEFVAKIRKVVNTNSVFLPMPSTTGRNKIPKRLAQKLGNKLGVEVISAPVVLPYGKQEAKKLRGIDKLQNQTRFIIPLEMERILKKFQNRDIFIIDDIFTTGQSINNLARMLADNGYHIPESISLSKASSSFTSLKDVEKMVEIAKTKLGINEDIARKKLNVLLNESSTIGFQIYQDLNTKSKSREEKYKNWFLDNN